jgi:hypothetical protein
VEDAEHYPQVVAADLIQQRPEGGKPYAQTDQRAADAGADPQLRGEQALLLKGEQLIARAVQHGADPAVSSHCGSPASSAGGADLSHRVLGDLPARRLELDEDAAQHVRVGHPL